MKILVALLLLFPSLAMAADECCFKGPGECSMISSDFEKEACSNLPSTVVLVSPCKEAPECMLSEEPIPQPPNDFLSGLEHHSELFLKDMPASR